MADVRIEGMADVVRRLRALPLHVKQKIADGAVREAAKVVQKDAIARAPHDTGLLKRSIRIARRRRGLPWYLSQFVVHVRGVQSSSGRRRRQRRGRGQADAQATDLLPFYWYFLEFGTYKMAARPFMRPAFDASGVSALERARDYARRRVDRAVPK
jgi:HK97 gp10 family phage protein